MEIKEAHIAVRRTARYFLSREPDANIKEVWFACHGQGQLAGYFIKHFAGISDDTRLIVAAEGLSRFYLDGMGGRVGAIWMTKEDRLHEIDDYLNYLNSLYREIFSQLDRKNVRVHVLGFSQGVATVCRWIGLGEVHVDELTLWAGQIPPDLDLAARRERFQHLKLNIVIGKQDQYASAEFIAGEEARLKQHDLAYRLLSFDGGHNLDAGVLAELAKR